MNETQVIPTHEPSHLFLFAYLPWVVSGLCVLISLKWLSPFVLTLVWIRALRRKGSIGQVSEKQKEKDAGKLKQTCAQASSRDGVEEEDGVETTTRYDKDWFTSPQVFKLEQRAIFSKTWLFATHSSRFTKPGDYHTQTLSTYPIFLILSRDNQIRAFHNVCRHRAYTITKKASGSSPILGCRYHGWSYNTLGKLVKAPEFEGVEGFEKRRNGLFEIRTRVGGDGGVWVNFDVDVDGGEGVDGDGRRVVGLKGMESDSLGVAGCRWVSGWSLEGDFNWKIAKDIPSTPNLETKPITTKWTSLFDLFKKPKSQKSIYVFPNTQLHISPSRKTWISVRYIPQTASKTTIQIDLYTSLPQNDPSNKILENRLKAYFQERVQMLEERQHSFVRHGMSMSKENLAKQDAIHESLIAHLKMERINGGEIYPAFRKETFSEAGKQDDDLCKELEGKKSRGMDGCLPSSESKKKLEW